MNCSLIFAVVIVLMLVGVNHAKKKSKYRRNNDGMNFVGEEDALGQPLSPYFRQPLFMQFCNKKVYAQGTDIVLPCMALGAAPISYTWYFNEQLLGQKKRHKFFHDSSTMKIKRVRVIDEGIYVCKASNMYGNLSFSYQVQLEEKPNAPVFADYSMMLRRQRNIRATRQPIILPCTAQSNTGVHYIWLKNGQTFMHVQNHENAVKNEEQVGDLTIDSLKVNDAGLYTCVALNKHGNVSFTYELRILWKLSGGPPKVIPFTQPTFRIARTGDEITLDCLEILSGTIPDVRWFHLFNRDDRSQLPNIPENFRWNEVNNRELSFASDYVPTHHYSVFKLESPHHKPLNDYVYDDTDPYGLRLTLINVTVADTGAYTCFVSNSEGSDYSMFFLKVD